MVTRLPHEEEGVAMDVDSATTVLPSSYAAAVHPDVTANVDKVLTVEDDALSTTSTIDYFYSEEEYPSENSGTDEEDSQDEEEDIDNIDIEEDEEEDIDDIDIEDDEEEDTDTWVIAPGAWKEATEGDPKYMIITSDDDDGEDVICNHAVADPPEKHLWVASWEYKDDPEQFTWINVYAYYNKEKRYGGYGVILRDTEAKPIIASAKFSADGKSFFHQVLTGVNAGVALADKYAPLVADTKRNVRCNSFKVRGLVDQTRFCDDDKCKEGTRICKVCEHYLTAYEGCNVSLWPLVQGLKHRKLFLSGFPRGLNEAAHYLAKYARDCGVQKKSAASDYDEEIKPCAFPPVLQDILWKDAFGMPHYLW